MSKKTFVYIGMFAGSIIGGYIPIIFLSQSLLSVSSLLGNTAGAIVGIFAGYKLGDYFE